MAPRHKKMLKKQNKYQEKIQLIKMKERNLIQKDISLALIAYNKPLIREDLKLRIDRKKIIKNKCSYSKGGSRSKGKV